MTAIRILISLTVLGLLASCTVPRPLAYGFYDGGYYDDPYYYRIPYAEPYIYKPYLGGAYYSGSPFRSEWGSGGIPYTGTYRGAGY